MAHLTNGHDIDLKKYYPKSILAGFGLLLLMGIGLLVFPATYYLGFFMVITILLGGAGFTWWKLNKELIKVYHLVRYDDTVYEWIERWEPRKNVEEGMSPAFFYQIKNELVPVIDFLDTDNPKPFKPFGARFNSVQSMDIGRTTDQSSAQRMLQSKSSLWSKQEVRLITYLAILGGIMFGIIAITGGDPPPPEIIQ
jgi:hypothetical protein|tara:strand:- start:14343 stop:14930 length:588 start_codon:yes stop_codon:yes gene_type:complete